MPAAVDDLLPIEPAHAVLTERFGSARFAVSELNRLLQEGLLHCQKWSFDGSRQSILPVGWVDEIEVVLSLKGRVWIYSRHPTTLAPRPVVTYSSYVEGYNRPPRMSAPRSVRKPIVDGAFLVSRSEFDALWPVQRASTETAAKVAPSDAAGSIKDRVAAAAQQMKDADEIPKSISRSRFAKELAQRIGQPDSWNYIRNQLEEWGLWPVERLKKKPL